MFPVVRQFRNLKWADRRELNLFSSKTTNTVQVLIVLIGYSNEMKHFITLEINILVNFPQHTRTSTFIQRYFCLKAPLATSPLEPRGSVISILGRLESNLLIFFSLRLHTKWFQLQLFFPGETRVDFVKHF